MSKQRGYFTLAITSLISFLCIAKIAEKYDIRQQKARGTGVLEENVNVSLKQVPVGCGINLNELQFSPPLTSSFFHTTFIKKGTL